MELHHLMVPKHTKVPILASLPHSGTYVPPDIRHRFKQNPRPILTNMDWHLEKLYDFLPELGITVLQATHSRYVVDLNRVIKEPLFGPNVSSVISQDNTQGNLLYDASLTKEEIEARLIKYYYPYHEKLGASLETIRWEYGHVFLLDLHSYFLYPLTDICLGNRNSGTCSERVLTLIEQAFNEHGFSVAKNERLTGGYSTRHYGSMPNVQSLQIELRFPAYLNGDYFGEEEVTEWDCEKFRRAKSRLRAVFSEVINKGIVFHNLN
jgi:N-formylglutamate deformylase